MGRRTQGGTCTRAWVGCCVSLAMIVGFHSGIARATSPQACGQQPVNICIMLDRTGSVSSSERSNEATAAKTLVGQIAALDNGTRVAIGRFGDNTNGGTEAEIVKTITAITPGNLSTFNTSIDNALASGSSVGTNVKDAIDVCKGHLVGNDNGKQNILMLISDFDPNEPSNPDASALSAATSAKGAGIRIFAIGFDTSGANSTDENNRTLGASIASGNALDEFCTAASCNGTATANENGDGDDWFLAPNATNLTAIFDSIFQVIQCEDDGNACTVNACDDETDLCTSTPIDNCLPCSKAGDCDDGNVCTNDSCVEGRCQYSDNDGASCEDGDGCTVDDECSGGNCEGGDPKECNDHRSCSSDECLSPSGECNFNLENCDCSKDSDCDDGNPCTDDSCNLDSGTCSNTPDDSNSCDDKSACSSGDHCDAGQCLGSTVSCDDGKPCTDDSCDPGKGCVFQNDDSNSCSDGLACTDGDTCESGACVPGEPVVCNDNRSCSTDQCLEPSGACDFDLEGCGCSFDSDCDDGNPCTDDSCDIESGHCSNEPDDSNSCDDESSCTGGDHCDDGQCLGSPVTCQDDNPCTDDSCDPETGCVFRNDDSNECDDEDGCTVGDACESGVCVPGGPKTCTDNRSCSADQCLSPSGLCDFDLSQCECQDASDCDDNNSCTDDTCSSETGLCENVVNEEIPGCEPPPPPPDGTAEPEPSNPPDDSGVGAGGPVNANPFVEGTGCSLGSSSQGSSPTAGSALLIAASLSLWATRRAAMKRRRRA